MSSSNEKEAGTSHNNVSRASEGSRKRRSRRRDPKSESPDNIESPQHTAKAPHSHHRPLIKIGPGYQANIETLIEENDKQNDRSDNDTLIWSTPEGINQKKLDKYICEAQERYGMHIDQALYILMNQGYNFKKARSEVSTRRLTREEWTDAEADIFRFAFKEYGKRFRKIQTLLPERSILSVVHRYYDTKKTDDLRASLAQRLNDDDAVDSDSDDCIFEKGECDNCGERSQQLMRNRYSEIWECPSCAAYVRMMEKPRPLLKNVGKSSDLECSYDLRAFKCPIEFRKAADFLLASNSAFGPVDADMGASSDSDVDDEATKREEEKPSNVELSVHCNGIIDQNKSDSIKSEIQDLELVGAQLYQKMKRELAQGESGRRYAAEAKDLMKLYNLERDYDSERKRSISTEPKNAVVKQETEREKRARKRAAQELEEKTKQKEGIWTDVEKQKAVYCFLRHGKDFTFVAQILPSKTLDEIAKLYEEAKLAGLEKMIADQEEEDREKAANVVVTKRGLELQNSNVVEYIDLD